MALTSFELRRVAVIARTFVPLDALAGTTGDLDAAALIAEDDGHSPWYTSLLLRAGIWLVWFAPLWTLTALRTFGGLTPEARAGLLDRLLHHRLYAVRQTVMFQKLIACVVLLGSVRVLTQVGAYHLADHQPNAPVGLRVARPAETGR